MECLGGYFGDGELPLFAMYVQGVTVRLGRANNGPFMASTLAALRMGTVRPSLWSTTFSWSDAPQVLASPPLKPVLVRERTPP